MKRPPKDRTPEPEPDGFLAELMKRHAERTSAKVSIELPAELVERAEALRERLERLPGLRSTLGALDRDGLLVFLFGSALETVERLELGNPVPEDLRALAAMLRAAGRRRREA